MGPLSAADPPLSGPLTQREGAAARVNEGKDSTTHTVVRRELRPHQTCNGTTGPRRELSSTPASLKSSL